MKSKYIKLVHIAKSQLNLDDDTYRHLLLNVTKKTSTKDMTVWELEKILNNLKSKGFKVKSSKKTGKITATEPVHKKIRSLWLELADAGVVKNRSEKAINSYVKRIVGVEVMDWLNTAQAMKVIESLKRWQARILRNKHEANTLPDLS
ncbi:gp16 family protein [Gilliamella sp. wkB112]|uniref:gp16 family protein n=1 Tax=Gilliamella sp. wkB112 TaxID=3120257 RepID=UPI00080DC1D6|nr:regulatory protein GemA [Gilliamella apicola]OCG02943.1 Rha family transcriptional regulator [Gilliamella apicola]